MRLVDQVLLDQELLHIVYDALARRWPMSRTRCRPGTPADVVVRLLLLTHIRNWSYAILEREVRANLVYRQFTRVGARRVPDAKTLGKLGVALGPEIIQKAMRSCCRAPGGWSLKPRNSPRKWPLASSAPKACSSR
jgi:IS5 family transposase